MFCNVKSFNLEEIIQLYIETLHIYLHSNHLSQSIRNKTDKCILLIFRGRIFRHRHGRAIRVTFYRHGSTISVTMCTVWQHFVQFNTVWQILDSVLVLNLDKRNLCYYSIAAATGIFAILHILF